MFIVLTSGCGGGGQSTVAPSDTPTTAPADPVPTVYVSGTTTSGIGGDPGSIVCPSVPQIDYSNKASISDSDYRYLINTLTQYPQMNAGFKWKEVYGYGGTVTRDDIHAGIDIYPTSPDTAYGRSVFAGIYGQIIYADHNIGPNQNQNNYGRVSIFVSDGETGGKTYTYLHLKDINSNIVKDGWVTPGTEIGHAGNTNGGATPHLHFEVANGRYDAGLLYGNASYNPYLYLLYGRHRYDITSQTTLSPLPYSKNMYISVRLELTNTGSENWCKCCQFPFRLGTSSYLNEWSSTNAKDRESEFYDVFTWLTKNRIEMNEETVTPGNVATFDFNLKTPNVSGPYRIYLQPLVEGRFWLNNRGIYFPVTVQ